MCYIIHMSASKLAFNQKAINSIAYTGYLNVWEGAVRSSKTVCSIVSFIGYVLESKNNVFIMSGKTISTLYRNCIGGEFGALGLFGNQIRYFTDTTGSKVLEIRGFDNQIKRIYCFGAHDESSFQTLRGLTAAGWYADEVNLHPKSFIDEAFRRTIVSDERKHFWTLNPDNPYHFIYTDYIDLYMEKKLKGFYLWFFTLDDNPSLSDERKEELKNQYSGIFYKRYILGLRCIAEGAIYDMFDSENIYKDSNKPDFSSRKFARYIAMDYGTTNPCVFLEIYDDGEIAYIEREYFYDSRKQMKQKTDEEYCDDFMEFNKGKRDGEAILDPSAESFAVALKKRGNFVTNANNEVENGIRRVSTMIGRKTIKVNEKCVNTIRELSTYAWDEKKSEKGVEEPVKQNDHTCDAIRYFVNTRVLSLRVGETVI